MFQIQGVDDSRPGRGWVEQLATDVAEGTIDLEQLNDPEVPDDEAATRLLALPGVGPYAAAHVMLTSLGRYSRLVLDSWTRPTYVKLSGARGALKDTTIERRFKRYGDWAGLAFWLYLTRGRSRKACRSSYAASGAAGAGALTGLQNQYGVVARRSAGSTPVPLR